MKSLFYSWMVFQILIGVWLFISPFVLGAEETRIATSNMIFGALVVILGIGTSLYEFHHKERLEREAPREMEHARQKV